ncbi:Hint domain-containing protein [Tritonibacter mobilis]|uniref:Hint domain-containing protein n=1 Tax=Tritonibacter mobilis TaxID=379347 RepID=UPI001C08C735|nr:Hint domain-containing protein [Tritonibacter mobilis]MBU3032960.1 Hint domain-containing protein [Tritonibacter mobilis]WHQ82146.1 Hint domain-containing protein [Tritonibacter mobilis]
MTTYSVTSSNYNDPGFWSSISEYSGGHWLDFRALPSTYYVNIDAEARIISIWDGGAWYRVGEDGNGSTDSNLGSPTSLDDFNIITGNDASDYIEASDGDDSIIGAGGDDTLSGDQGDDTIDGGEGNDNLAGGDGQDRIFAEAGNDSVYADNVWATLSSAASGTGTTPTSLTVTNSADGPIELWWIDGAGQLQYHATIQPGDTLTQSTYEEYNWELRHPDDWYLGTIQGGANPTVNFGASGLNDTVFAGSGDDLVLGMYGDDVIYGETGTDTLDGDYGDDTIWAGTDADTVEGGDGDDYLSGQEGDDLIQGGAGSDTLIGGTGNDELKGDADDDTFQIFDNSGVDTIIGGESGVDDDLVDLSGRSSGASVNFTGAEIGIIEGGSDTAYFQEIERLRLTDFDDSLDASASSTGVNVDAGAGADTLTGSAGDDSLTGGGGDDRFVMTTSGGADTISDFDLTDDDLDGFYNDQIDVSGLSGGSGAGGLVTASDVIVTDDGSGSAVLTFPDGEQLVLKGVAPSMINTQPQLYAAGIPCFTPGIRIATARGAIPVEQIRTGDLLQTADNGLQPVIWTGRRDLSGDDLIAQPHLMPLVLHPGGPFANDRPLMISPQHRFMLDRPRLGDLGHMNEAFVRARLLHALLPDRVVRCSPQTGVSYIHLMTETHQVIFAEGIATETFWPGPEALRGLADDDRRELFDVFPELFLARRLSGSLGRSYVASKYCQLARADLTRRDLRALGARFAA